MKRPKINGLVKWVVAGITIAGIIYAAGREFATVEGNVKANTENIQELETKTQANAHEIAVVAKGVSQLQTYHAVDSTKYDAIKDDLKEIKELIKGQ